jgi:hypothetical protein
MSSLRARGAISATIAVLIGLLLAGVAYAHVVKQAGPYTLEIGWQHEPTYVGEANGVQVIVHDADENPITDLGTDDLKVVVSTGDQQTGELTFDPRFDLEEGEGPLGEYNAPIMPTAPGDYTFHLTGAIHGEAIDITVTSSDETFDTVKGTADIQFPTKLPALPDLVTRLDRIDERLSNNVGPSQEAVDAAQQRADLALMVGGGLGLLGVLIGVSSLIFGRGRTRAASD